MLVINKNLRLFLNHAAPWIWMMIVMIGLVLKTGRCRAEDIPLSLEAALSEAIANHALIQETIEKQRAALENTKSAAADLLPKFSTGYQYSHFKETPYVVFNGMPFDAWKEDRFAWNVSVTQPLFTGFALTTRRKIADLGLRISEIEKEQAVCDVVLKVQTAYFNILLAHRYLEVADEAVTQLEGHVTDAQQFYDQEMIPQNDLLRSQVALANARQNRVHAAGNLSVAKAALSTLLRRDITADLRVAEISAFEPTAVELADLLARAMTGRPELKHLETALIQAGLGVQMAKSNYYPKVYLAARYEQLGDNLRATENAFGNSYNTIIGVEAQWQFFEWGKTKADVGRAEYELKALESKVDGIRDAIRLEVKSAYEKLLVADQNIKTAETALTQAKENFRITNLQYQQQIAASTDVIDAQTFLSQAEVNYYSALYGYRIAKAELDRAVGETNTYLQVNR
jgi:outer membrane protein TolC